MSEGSKRFCGCSMSFVGYLGWCGVVAGFIVQQLYILGIFLEASGLRGDGAFRNERFGVLE